MVISFPPRRVLALAKVVSRSMSDGLTGLEFCAVFPGVWRRCMDECRSLRKRMKDVIKTVFLLDATGEKKIMNREEIFSVTARRVSCRHNNAGAQFKLKKGERF